jgi:S1-C subfamily serine protease
MGTLSFYMKKNLVFISLFLLFMCGCANLENFNFHEKVSIGTGFFVNEKGALLTAYHVIKGKQFIYGKKNGIEKWEKLEVITYDEKLDVAVLEMKGQTSSTKISTWENIPIGMEVYVIGFPLPNIKNPQAKFTEGLINSNVGLKGNNKIFQISAGVQKGNSGGPVISPDGKIIGLVQKKLIPSNKSQDQPQNINFAIKCYFFLPLLEKEKINFYIEQTDLGIKKRPFEIFNDLIDGIVVIRASDNKLSL